MGQQITAASDPAKALSEAIGCEVSEIEAALRMAGATDKDIAKAVKFVQEQEETNTPYVLELEVMGEPSAAKRARRRNPLKGGGFMFDPDEDVKLTLGERFKMELPKDFVQIQGEAEVEIFVYRSPPTGFVPYRLLLAELGYIRPAVAPDFDNYAKLIIDTIRKSVFRDDAQIVMGAVFKGYSLRPRTVLRITARPHRMVK